jgi:hypothetical protein
LLHSCILLYRPTTRSPRPTATYRDLPRPTTTYRDPPRPTATYRDLPRPTATYQLHDWGYPLHFHLHFYYSLHHHHPHILTSRSCLRSQFTKSYFAIAIAESHLIVAFDRVLTEDSQYFSREEMMSPMALCSRIFAFSHR